MGSKVKVLCFYKIRRKVYWEQGAVMVHVWRSGGIKAAFNEAMNGLMQIDRRASAGYEFVGYLPEHGQPAF